MGDAPRIIYLSVACNPDPDYGRTWSETGDGPDCICGRNCRPVKYIIVQKGKSSDD